MFFHSEGKQIMDHKNENNLGSCLYVTNLHPDVDEISLYCKFSEVGPVTFVSLSRDVFTKQSLCNAYIKYKEPRHMDEALFQLNFTYLKNLPLRVMRSNKDLNLNRSYSGYIFLQNLHKDINNAELYNTFAQFGSILSCKILSNNNRTNGLGYVNFEDDRCAQEAIKRIHGKTLRGMKVFAKKYIPRREVALHYFCIKNLPKDMDEKKLKAIFKEVVPVENIKISICKSGTMYKFGLICFKEFKNAIKAMEIFNNKFVNNKTSKYQNSKSETMELTYMNQFKTCKSYIKTSDNSCYENRLYNGHTSNDDVVQKIKQNQSYKHVSREERQVAKEKPSNTVLAGKTNKEDKVCKKSIVEKTFFHDNRTVEKFTKNEAGQQNNKLSGIPLPKRETNNSVGKNEVIKSALKINKKDHISSSTKKDHQSINKTKPLNKTPEKITLSLNMNTNETNNSVGKNKVVKTTSEKNKESRIISSTKKDHNSMDKTKPPNETPERLTLSVNMTTNKTNSFGKNEVLKTTLEKNKKDCIISSTKKDHNKTKLPKEAPERLTLSVNMTTNETNNSVGKTKVLKTTLEKNKEDYNSMSKTKPPNETPEKIKLSDNHINLSLAFKEKINVTKETETPNAALLKNNEKKLFVDDIQVAGIPTTEAQKQFYPNFSSVNSQNVQKTIETNYNRIECQNNTSKRFPQPCFPSTSHQSHLVGFTRPPQYPLTPMFYLCLSQPPFMSTSYNRLLKSTQANINLLYMKQIIENSIYSEVKFLYPSLAQEITAMIIDQNSSILNMIEDNELLKLHAEKAMLSLCVSPEHIYVDNRNDNIVRDKEESVMEKIIKK